MVFEHLFPTALLERKAWSAFVLAFIYSTISIIIARLIFGANSGIASVMFLSIFLIPYFSTLLKREERQEEEERGGFLSLLKDNSDMIRIYVCIFFGVYLAYMLYTFVAPVFGWDVSRLFGEQLALESLRGGAFSAGTFWAIFLNNWWVLLACFLVALVAGDGAIFFIAWNASSWGAIFGYRAMMASQFDGRSALLTLLIIVLITLPHVLLEGLAYMLAAISGGVISDEIVEKTSEIKAFVVYFIAAVIVYVVLYMLLRSVFKSHALLIGVLGIVLAMTILHMMQYLFSSVRDQRVFRYNFWLFVLAIAVFLIGATVETFVLGNADALRSIYVAAQLAG